MTSNVVKFLAIYVLLGSFSASAQEAWQYSVAKKKVLNEQLAGPADYHNLYSKIRTTVVTVKNFYIRTVGGTIIPVETDDMTVDLQDMQAKQRGLELDLRTVNLPRGGVTVAEIEMDLTDRRPSYFLTSDGVQCALRTSNRITFFTRGLMTVDRDLYLVKVQFRPLKSIQIDLLKQWVQNQKCCPLPIFNFACVDVGRPYYNEKLSCAFPDERQVITKIIPKAVDI